MTELFYIEESGEIDGKAFLALTKFVRRPRTFFDVSRYTKRLDRLKEWIDYKVDIGFKDTSQTAYARHHTLPQEFLIMCSSTFDQYVYHCEQAGI